jgi:hypothetical protein
MKYLNSLIMFVVMAYIAHVSFCSIHTGCQFAKGALALSAIIVAGSSLAGYFQFKRSSITE